MDNPKCAVEEEKVLEALFLYLELAYKSAPTQTPGALTRRGQLIRIELDEEAVKVANKARDTWIAASQKWVDCLHGNQG